MEEGNDHRRDQHESRVPRVLRAKALARQTRGQVWLEPREHRLEHVCHEGSPQSRVAEPLDQTRHEERADARAPRKREASQGIAQGLLEGDLVSYRECVSRFVTERLPVREHCEQQIVAREESGFGSSRSRRSVAPEVGSSPGRLTRPVALVASTWSLSISQRRRNRQR